MKRWNILWQALVSLKQALLHSEEGFYENLLFKQTKDRSKALCLLASACVPYKMFCKQHLSLKKTWMFLRVYGGLNTLWVYNCSNASRGGWVKEFLHLSTDFENACWKCMMAAEHFQKTNRQAALIINLYYHISQMIVKIIGIIQMIYPSIFCSITKEIYSSRNNLGILIMH